MTRPTDDGWSEIADRFARRLSDAIHAEWVPGMERWEKVWDTLADVEREWLRRLRAMSEGRAGPQYVGEVGNEVMRAFRRVKGEYLRRSGLKAA